MRFGVAIVILILVSPLTPTQAADCENPVTPTDLNERAATDPHPKATYSEITNRLRAERNSAAACRI